MKRKILQIFLSLILCCTMSACRSGKTDLKNYTYNKAITSTPANFNPHDLTAAGTFEVLGQTMMGFLGIGMDEDKAFVRTYEMADSVKDITAEFKDKEQFNIQEGETNRVWEIKLNQNAKWENGDVINADTYIYSMKQLLDYDMKNQRATEFTEGITAICKAKDYMYNGKKVPVYLNVGETDKAENKLYYSLDEIVPVLGCSLKDTYSANPSAFQIGGTDYYKILENNTVKENDFYVVDDNSKEALRTVAAGLGNADLWYVMTFETKTYEAKWEDVGFFKTDDYTLIYITQEKVETDSLYSKFSTGFLVHPELYEQCKTTVAGLTASTYGTSVDTYMSYGPYKLVSFESDKQIVLTKNDNWYGYHDKDYEHMYQTTDIIMNVVPSHESQMEQFIMGNLDEVVLNADDMKTYKYSDYLLKQDETLVFSICFNTNLDELKNLENIAGDKINRRVGAYKDFRDAFSYAINRKDFTDNGTAGSKPQYGIFNSMYYYDINNDSNSIYRNTKYAKTAIAEHYGLNTDASVLDKNYESITGYDLEKSKVLFQSAYDQMKKDGNYKDGQNITLTCIASEQTSLNAEKKSQEALLNKYIQEATKGTGFEGKINIVFTCSPTMYTDFVNGNSEMILSVKYGADLSPYYQMSKYIDTQNFVVPEVKAYNPNHDELSVEINGTKVTKTISQWSQAINTGGEYVSADIDTKLLILSKLEQFLLDEAIDIPIYSRCQVSLSSKKVIQGSDVYNSFYGFGGIAYMTYAYDDEAWQNYLEENPNGLSYE